MTARAEPEHPTSRGNLSAWAVAHPALILFLADFVSRFSQSINHKRIIRQAFVAVAMLAVLVVVADLGTALVPVITAVEPTPETKRRQSKRADSA